MQIRFTRREKIVTALFMALLIAVFLFPNLLASEYEIVYLLLVVVPLGWLIATDKERSAKA